MTPPYDRTDPAYVLAERIAQAMGFEWFEHPDIVRPVWRIPSRTEGQTPGKVVAWLVTDPFSDRAVPRPAVTIFVWAMDRPYRPGCYISIDISKDTARATMINAECEDHRDICRTIDAACDGILFAGLVNAGDERALRWYRGEE